MGWHIQEFGSASAIRQKLSQSAADYDKARDVTLKEEVPPGQNPHNLPQSTTEDEKLRQSAVNAILAVLDEAKGDVRVKVNAFGHSQAVTFTDEQLKSLPPDFNKDTRQVALTVTVSTMV